MPNDQQPDQRAMRILEAAAVVLGDTKGMASMGAIAAAAGVSRATLYRYFPDRETLFAAMMEVATNAVIAVVAEAQLESVAFEQAIGRLTRALISVGKRYRALADQEIVKPDGVRSHEMIHAPILGVIKKGVADGVVRNDIAVEVLAEMYGGMVQRAVQISGRADQGVESTSAAVVAVFLSGISAPESTRRVDRAH